MREVNVDDFTITMPLGKCNDYTIDLIQHMLDNFDNKIVVIYREKEPKDYIINSRIKYVKNTVEKHYAKIVNQSIRETETEYVLFNNWKAKPVYEDLVYGVNQLNKGYGWVDICPILVTSLFSKHLISKIGFLDEWYIHSFEVDWDLICTLRHYDIAYCGQKISNYNKWVTMQGGTNSTGAFVNYQKFTIKWKNTPNGFERLIKEKNYKDKDIYKNIFSERNYLKFKDSIIEDKYTVERCNLNNSGISMSNFINRITDEERKNLQPINFEYN